MDITARTLRRTIAVAAVAATGLASGAPAQASDASLRKAVTAQESKVDAQSVEFAADTKDLVSAVGRERATTAHGELATAVRKMRTAVTAAKPSTDRIRRLRTAYLAAVTSTQTGLKTFEAGLEAFDPDAPAKAAALFKKAKEQLKAASTRRDTAAKALGARP